MKNIKKTTNPIFSHLHDRWGGLLFFKYKIGNNDFITIFGSVNVKCMIPITIYCSNPTENVLGGSIGHTESPWALNITSIVLTSRVHLILGSKNRFIAILAVFARGSHHEVALIGLGFIGLCFMCTKYINFLMSHTSVSDPSISGPNASVSY